MSTIIKVDRNADEGYYNWQRVNSELTGKGPAEYDLNNVEFWSHEEQNDGAIPGTRFYNDLVSTGRVARCLSLQDGRMIRNQISVDTFRRLFNHYLFLWGSVLKDGNGILRVPYMYIGCGGLRVEWRRLIGDYFDKEAQAVLYPADVPVKA